MPRLDEVVNRAEAASADPARPVELVPEGSVRRLSATSFEAIDADPWLKIGLADWPRGRWVRIRYRSGWLDDPVRPLLRLDRALGPPDILVLPGPVSGSGLWVGRIPEDLVGMAISPASRAGMFAFAVDAVDVVARPRLVVGAWRRRPGLTMEAAWERLCGRRLRARILIASAWNARRIEDYPSWLAEREAPPLPDELGTSAASENGGEIELLIDTDGSDGAALTATLASISPDPAVRIRAVAGSPLRPDVREALAPASARDPRIAPEPLPLGEVWDGSRGWVGIVRAGDLLAARALDAFRAALHREPSATLLYSDEDRIDADGRRSEPRLKPDWSPRLAAARPYLGGLLLARRPIRAASTAGAADLESAFATAALADPGAVVCHVRRILLHRRRPAAPMRPATAARRVAAPAPLVSVVVPTRDRLNLLRPCIEGLLHRTKWDRLQVVIVDNGSVEAATHAFYADILSDPRIAILERPGPFNYSALTNAGVAASDGDMLLLLNNDVEVTEPGWLRALVDEATIADVGAVGAKLLYPSGLIQHAGVVLGLGGEAGHVYRNRPDPGAGAMGQLDVPHEVSAVTGACLAVSRSKLDLAGGLDEERFPISYNDIDLCLKLRRLGFRNLMIPGAVLVHHESASRGRDVGPRAILARREATAFAEAWRDAIRDDPYFHPALSLARLDTRLG